MDVYALITKHEGVRNKVYLDTADPPNKTIGVGWNLEANKLPADIDLFLTRNGYITDDHVQRLLEISIRHATADCRVLFPGFDGFTAERKAALIDVVFNMGFGRIRLDFPQFIKCVNAGDWPGAANELKYENGKTKKKLSGYWKQTKGRAKTIYGLIEGETWLA